MYIHLKIGNFNSCNSKSVDTKIVVDTKKCRIHKLHPSQKLTRVKWWSDL